MFPVSVGHAGHPATHTVCQGVMLSSWESEIVAWCLSCASSQLTNTPLPTMFMSPQKEGSSKTATSKTLTPASLEKKAEESSTSSDEDLPSNQVGRPCP